MTEEELYVFARRFERVRARERRFYTLRIDLERQLDLPGVTGSKLAPSWTLTVTRGRIGGKAIVRREPFPSLAGALERWGALCARRRQRKYEEVDG